MLLLSYYSSSSQRKGNHYSNNVKQILAEKTLESKLEIRKKNLFSILSAKRLQMPRSEGSSSLDHSTTKTNQMTEKNDNLIELLQTNHEESILKGLIIIRNTISVNNPPIKEVFTQTLGIKLIQLIDKYGRNQQILLETLWIITNFSYGDSQYTKVFYDNDLIPRLTSLIRNNPLLSYTIIDQLAWLIANFAVDAIEYKQSFYDNKFLDFFIQALEDWNNPLPIKENILRAISNIIQGISLISQSKMKYKLIQHMQSIIINIVIFDAKQLPKDKFKYLRYSIQIIFYLSEKQEEILNLLFKNDFFKYLLAILKETNDDSIITLIVYFLNNLSELENDSFITNLIQLDLFDLLSSILRKKYFANSNIVKVICQFLNNLSSLSSEYLNSIIESEDLLFILFAFAKDSKYNIDHLQFNVFEVITTLLDTNTKKYIKLLIKKGVIDLIIKYSFREDNNHQTEFNALRALYQIFEYLSDNPAKIKLLIIRLDHSGLSEKLRNNALCSNHFIADISDQIVYDFYSDNNDDEVKKSLDDSSDSFYNSD